MDSTQFKEKANDLLVFFRPVGQSRGFHSARLSLRSKILQLSAAIASALAILILSGISLAAMAVFMVSGLFLLLIFDRILGIEVLIPNPQIF